MPCHTYWRQVSEVLERNETRASQVRCREQAELPGHRQVRPSTEDDFPHPVFLQGAPTAWLLGGPTQEVVAPPC